MRKVIKENESALIVQIKGKAEYQYWVYEITPIERKNVNGIDMVFGGNILWHGMYKTLEEANKEYELLSKGN